MSPLPADSADPAPERPPRWWRNRRRWFYLAVVGATGTALWGGWVWWYRADFPFPRLHEAQTFGIDLSRHEPWYYGHQERLRIWKIKRETRRLRLEGTVWEDRDNDVTFQFRADGRLVIEGTPGWEDRILLSYASPGIAKPPPEARAALAALNGATFRHLKDVEWNDWGWPDQPNVELSESPWTGFLSFTGRMLQIGFFPPDHLSDLAPIDLRLHRREP